MADELQALDDGHDPRRLAERYLLGELDDAAAAAFEQRLADDEATAAALATTVRLLAAVEAARPVVAPRSSSARPVPRATTERSATLAGRGAAIGVIATATALSALLVLQPVASRRGAVDDVGPRDVVREVAIAAEADADEPPASDDVPEWLLAAVALEADDGDGIDGAAGTVREN